MNSYQALLPNTVILVGISELISKFPCVTQEEILLLSVQELQLGRLKYFKLRHKNKLAIAVPMPGHNASSFSFPPLFNSLHFSVQSLNR